MRTTPAEHATAFEERLAMLNSGQLATIEALRRNLASTDAMEPKCIFIDGPGGTGKTFLLEVTIVLVCFITLIFYTNTSAFIRL